MTPPCPLVPLAPWSLVATREDRQRPPAANTYLSPAAVCLPGSARVHRRDLPAALLVDTSYRTGRAGPAGGLLCTAAPRVAVRTSVSRPPRRPAAADSRCNNAVERGDWRSGDVLRCASEAGRLGGSRDDAAPGDITQAEVRTTRKYQIAKAFGATMQGLRHVFEIGRTRSGPCTAHPYQKLKSPRIWSIIFFKWPKFTLKIKQNKNKMKFSELIGGIFPPSIGIGRNASPRSPPGGVAHGSRFFLNRTYFIEDDN